MNCSSKSFGTATIFFLALALGACSSVAPKRFPDPEQFSWVELPHDIKEPVFITNAGDGSGRLFVVIRRGKVEVIANGELLPTLFLDIGSKVNREFVEQGLLGLAFHPNYEQNGYLYVYYINLDGDSVLSRYQVSDNPNRVLHASEKVLLTIEQPEGDHNGGHLEFGPDGYLYIGLGDGGHRLNAISPENLLGTILRIDVDNGDPYAIPEDNPFIDGGGRPEIRAYGLRNPWSFSLDPLTGDLYIADVGEKTWEEINFLANDHTGIVNFGWPFFEGNHALEDAPPDTPALTFPVAEYKHDEGRCAVTGGVVYRGEKYPEWRGIYLYGDFCSGEIFGLFRDNEGQWQTKSLFKLPIRITSIGVDEEGEIYAVGFRRGLKLFMLTEN